MAAVDQERLTTEELAEVARQVMAEYSVEGIKLESTAKGLRLARLTVHREPGESWASVIERTTDIVEALERSVGALV